MTTDDDLFERAIRTYVELMALSEPMRFRLWDSRGLTMTQLRLMFTLFQKDGVAMGTLAQEMKLSTSAMTGVIDRLRRSKLIRRRADRRDRRVTRVYLTEEGRTLWAEIDAASRTYISEIVRRLGRERVETFVEAVADFLEAATEVREAEALT